MESDQLQASLFLLDDRIRLIAACRIQRWEIVKWVATVNLALAATSITLKQFGFVFFVFSGLAAAGSCALIFRYNADMTRYRRSAARIHKHLKENGIDTQFIAGTDFTREKTPDHDWTELAPFYATAMLSVLPSIIAMLV